MKKPQNHGLPQTVRIGNWLPNDINQLRDWVTETAKKAKAANLPLHPVMQTFLKMIETDPVMHIGFTSMFYEGANPPPTVQKDSGDIVISTYQEMIMMINYILTTAPEYNTTGMVGFPINAILDFAMITLSGLNIFANAKANAMWAQVLKTWAVFLDSPDSRYVLNDSDTGWLSPAAIDALGLDQFQWNPDEPYGGWKSWNDFFIREFKEGERPVASPDDDKVIVSACEAAPYNLYQDCAERFNTFWIKSQPYSLQDLLAGNFVDYYIGGSIYQAYLSAENYHRWHSPINGTIVKTVQVPGTYYSETIFEGFDAAGPNNSQGYIAHVATRAIIFIQSPDPVIGMVAVVPIGMAEVSSCKVTVKAGQQVKKGEQIGYFLFGGSTHCVLFQKGAIKEWSEQAIPKYPQDTGSPVVKLSSQIATAN